MWNKWKNERHERSDQKRHKRDFDDYDKHDSNEDKQQSMSKRLKTDDRPKNYWLKRLMSEEEKLSNERSKRLTIT